MTSILAKFIAKKVLGETAKNRYGKDDPYFERVPANQLNGAPSKKVKRQPKAFPPGISERDKKILTKARRRAYILDMGFNICGIQFGMSSIIGIVPAIGDFLDLFMALMVLRTCSKVDDGLPSAIRGKMIMNIILDFAVGLVPFLGDVADALFRANTRNVILLEEHLKEKGARAMAGSYPSQPQADPRFEPQDAPPAYESQPATSTYGNTRDAPRRPDAAQVRLDSGWSRGWFGGRSESVRNRK